MKISSAKYATVLTNVDGSPAVGVGVTLVNTVNTDGTVSTHILDQSEYLKEWLEAGNTISPAD
tara:strand:- start:36 stop:224 length:189 start_codon:yes stop_codon:yes gene_type:complete